jgi:CRISPR-associated autoregulator DevR family
MSKAIVIGYLAKVSAANVNASHTEGNVVVAKKVTLPDGSTIPYISGQAVRRMLRDRLEELGYPLSEPFAQVSGQEVTPPVRPWEFVDEDLFGYLDPSGGRRRTSPVRVSAAVGLFPFQGDRDLGTRSFERFGQAMAAGGNMFETELYANLFKGTVLVELDRVGVFRPGDWRSARMPNVPFPLMNAASDSKRSSKRSTSSGAAGARRGCWRTFPRSFLPTRGFGSSIQCSWRRWSPTTKTASTCWSWSRSKTPWTSSKATENRRSLGWSRASSATKTRSVRRLRRTGQCLRSMKRLPKRSRMSVGYGANSS